MTQAFREAINRLPQIIEKNAPGIMRRIVARMKLKALAEGAKIVRRELGHA